MPGRKIKVNFGGQEKEASEVHINTMNENVNTYVLDDGTVLSMRTVVISVARIDDVLDPDGNPVYVVKSQNIVSPSIPQKE